MRCHTGVKQSGRGAKLCKPGEGCHKYGIGSEEEVVSVHKQLKEETACINALDLTPVVETYNA